MSFKDEYKDYPVEGALIVLMWGLALLAAGALTVLLVIATRGIILVLLLVLPAFYGLAYFWLKREAKR